MVAIGSWSLIYQRILELILLIFGDKAKTKIAKRRIDFMTGNVNSYARILNGPAQLDSISTYNNLAASLSKYIYLYIYLSQENIKNGPNWNFKTFMQKPCVIKNNVFDAENLNFFLFSEVKVKVFYP